MARFSTLEYSGTLGNLSSSVFSTRAFGSSLIVLTSADAQHRHQTRVSLTSAADAIRVTSEGKLGHIVHIVMPPPTAPEYVVFVSRHA